MAREQLPARFDPAPFIFGVPRSGTTLLRMMLDAHPHLAIPPETHFVPEVAALAGSENELRAQLYQVIVGSARWPDFQLEESQFRKRLLALRPLTTASGVRCFYQMYAARFGKPRWGDKTPSYSPTLDPVRNCCRRPISSTSSATDGTPGSRKPRPGGVAQTMPQRTRACGSRRSLTPGSRLGVANIFWKSDTKICCPTPGP